MSLQSPYISRSGYRFSSLPTSRVKMAAILDTSSKSMSSSAPGASGYSADSEKTPGEPPVSIDLLPNKNKNKHSAPDAASERAKRMKIEESNYVAATALSELERQGVHLPRFNKSRPRLFPQGCKVDMSSVEHKYSKDLASTTVLFRGPEEFAIAAPNSTLADFFLYGEETLPLLLRSCKHHYRKTKQTPTPDSSSKKQQSEQLQQQQQQQQQESSNSGVSSTSSVTSDPGGSADSSSSPEEDILPVFTSIGDALSLSKEARIVTLSEEPFLVVHVNAAFSRLTSLSSIRIQGKQLRDLIEGEELLEALKTSSNSRTTSTMKLKQCKSYPPPPSTTKNHNHQPCAGIAGGTYKVVISPVGSPDEAPTHVVIGLSDYGSD